MSFASPRVLAGLLAALLLSLVPIGLRAAPSYPTVLYLMSEAPASNAYYSEMTRGLRDVLDQKLPHVQVYSENLDLARFDNPAYRRELSRWLQHKYGDIRLDVVVVAGSPALRYLTAERLWPGVPTYFVSANDDTVRAMTLPPNITGQTVVVALPDTVALIGRLFPGTRKVALVANPRGHDAYRPHMDEELKALTRRFELIDLRGKPQAQVLEAIARLPQDAVVYQQTYTLDGDGRVFDPYLSLNLSLQWANRPVFVDYTTFLGNGAVGGIGIDSHDLGQHGGEAVVRLLQGTLPSVMPHERRAFGPVVDARALRRWHVDPALLPPGTRVLFDEPSEWQRYRVQILGAGAAIAALTLLVLALLLQRRRRERAVAASRASLAQLAQLNRAATAAVYSGAIAHELNQPLAAIMSNAEAAELFLGASPPRVSEAHEALADIKRDNRRASQIIRRMRGMLKRTGQVAEVVDMRRVIADVVAFITPEARMRQAAIRTVMPGVAVPVLGDPVRLQQLLVNLLINAMDAMAGLPAAHRVVDVIMPPPGPGSGQVTLRVVDRGPGFPTPVEHLFDSFITTKEHGSGLGLAITAAIVREHAGRISACNLEPPFGAEVSVTLPLTQAAPASEEHADG